MTVDIGKLVAEIASEDGYERLEELLKCLPMSWYPALLKTMVQAAYDKKVFLPGRASQFIAKTVEWTPPPVSSGRFRR